MKWFKSKPILKVTVSGPGITGKIDHYFSAKKGGTLNLFTDIIDCDNGGNCETKKPGTYVFEMIPID